MNVEYHLDGDVAVVTLNRPERFNAIEAGLAGDMIDALHAAEDESRAMVLTGAGKAFCSGADLSQLMDQYDTGGPDLARLLDDVFHPMILALANARIPTVAAVNGVAAGAGLGLALGCDIRLMAESAFLTSAFTAIGLIPDSGTTWWLPQHIGVSKAIELTMTNRRVDAAEAKTLGLCYEIVPDDEVVDGSGLIREASELSFEEALEAERAAQGRLGKTPEHQEGVAAFLEKRKPNFRDP
jgi:2-(1,2-epoxy-1,2-dihydrophenyl)acetyl-CoA isomerase